MSPHRTKRNRSAAATGSKLPPADGSEDKSPGPRRATQLPTRNVTLLSISIVIYVIWILFLVYVALFK